MVTPWSNIIEPRLNVTDLKLAIGMLIVCEESHMRTLCSTFI